MDGCYSPFLGPDWCIKLIILQIKGQFNCKDFFIAEPNEVNNMVWKLFQHLLAAH